MFALSVRLVLYSFPLRNFSLDCPANIVHYRGFRLLVWVYWKNSMRCQLFTTTGRMKTVERKILQAISLLACGGSMSLRKQEKGELCPPPPSSSNVSLRWFHWQARFNGPILHRTFHKIAAIRVSQNLQHTSKFWHSYRILRRLNERSLFLPVSHSPA